jgi:hypothetical protein
MRYLMRPRACLTSLSFVVSSWAGSGCIAPAHPDDYVETVQGVQTSADAGGSMFGPADAALHPGSMLPITPLGPTAFDAGSAGGPVPRDSSVSGGPLAGPDAGTRVEAGVASDAGASLEASAPQDASGGSISSCTITATTDASNTSFFYYGKYGCAVWIGDSAKRVIKAFFVATRISSRSGLPAYQAASSGVRVDVTTGATLSAPKQHQFTWPLIDSTGAKVPPGSFTLNVETHSENGVTLVTVPFATTAPVSEMAAPKAEVLSAGIVCD